MTTMFDAPMHDFSTDSVMDADMLPSASSDTDWLHAEKMIEDGDVQEPPPEVEMTDIGDADARLSIPLDQMSPDELEHLLSVDPLDEEIPDASRATSPSNQGPASQSQALAALIRSEWSPEEPSIIQEPLYEVTQPPRPDSTTPHRSPEAGESYAAPTPDLHNKDNPLSEVVETLAEDDRDTSTISGKSSRSPVLQQGQQTSEKLEYDGPAENSAEISLVDHNEGSHGEEHVHTAEVDAAGLESEPQAEILTEGQGNEADDDGLLMDPPPTVLLLYPFDNTRFALFNLPEDSQSVHIPASSTLEAYSTADDQTKGESKIKDTNDEGSRPDAESDHHTESDSTVVLFHDRFVLYYEPLSLVFNALRADPASNVGGRFDLNIELVISVPELDLTLPEDNVHTREVSLHDLGVLHNGCDLNGPLSLVLDTVSPRFGTRYKAIRDEIVRVVSQQEDQSGSNPGDGYLDGGPFHESSGVQVLSEVSYNTDHNLAESGDDHTSEQHLAEGYVDAPEYDVASSLQVQESEAQAEGDVYEGSTLGEYAVYDEFDADQAGDDAEQSYQDAGGEYAEEEDEEYIIEENYGDVEAHHTEELEQPRDDVLSFQEGEHMKPLVHNVANASLGVTGETSDDLYESVTVSGEGEVPPAEASGKRETIPLEQHLAPEESTSPQAATPGAATNDRIDTHEHDANVSGDIAVQSLIPPTHLFSDDETSQSSSGTPRPSTSMVHTKDELIAYEDTREDEPCTPSQTNLPSVNGSRAVFTASKRSYDEHELDQPDGAQPRPDVPSKPKRLRI